MRKKSLWTGAVAVMSVLLTAAVLYPMLANTTRPSVPAEVPVPGMAAGAGRETKLNTNYVSYEGGRYAYNHDLYNILFLGIDETEAVPVREITGPAGHADSIILLSFNKAEKTIRLLQISGDTMTDIELYDSAGKRFAVIYGQLALQHAYAPGAEHSSWAMRRAVGKILSDLQINAYVTLNIEGVPILNDEIGGVELTFADDYTDLDAAFEQGQTVVLDGPAAARFVRKQNIYINGSDRNRMNRQIEYIRVFFRTVKKRQQEGRLDLEQIQEKAGHFLATDMRLEEIEELLKDDYDIKEVCFVPGEFVRGQADEEFYVDDDALKRLLIEMFYEPVPD